MGDEMYCPVNPQAVLLVDLAKSALTPSQK
jgi:hypothetical protein